MMRSMCGLVLLLAGCATMDAGSKVASTAADDPYLWLEDIEAPRALTQVRKWNAATARRLASSDEFEKLRSDMRAVLEDDSRIAAPERILGGQVTNHWTDKDHKQGLWRIAGLEAFAAGRPQWRTLIDLDALSAAEGKKFVWEGDRSPCRAPTYDRCMVGLSDGGSDALVHREFDMLAGRFVQHGFATTLPAKAVVAWFGPDALLIRSDFGPGTLTTSGYGRQVRLWQRGTPLASARVVFEAAADEVGAAPGSRRSAGRDWPMITQSVSYWETRYHHVRADGSLAVSPLPLDAEVKDMLDGRVIAVINKDWADWKAGSIVAYDAAAVERGDDPATELVFAPSARQAVEEIRAGSDRLYVNMLDDVSGRLVAFRRDGGRWIGEDVAVPPSSVLTLKAAGGSRDHLFFATENFAAPETLMVTRSGAAPARVDALKAFFDPASVEVAQHFATSKDGTRVPYYLVRPAGKTGALPTIMHAYGGFRNAQKPTYLTKNPYQIGPGALFWLEAGGSFAIAGIRGGGEYGPEWHAAALREKRQNSYDDLYAVAETLKREGLASKLAISGRSQGGMLVGVAMTQRPELFDAVIMGVPLADMKRYNKLLAGASWMGEYGDPDLPEDWAFISKYSPYQNLKPALKTPPVIIYTSTKDDRVHPGHARKMAAKLEAHGQPFEYYENIEGGHAGTSDAGEHAYRAALMYAFAKRELMAK
jgi:prolyl oligopeptidase